MNNGVIVLGGHIQGLNIIRIYGKSNFPAILIDKDSLNLAKHSKYCKKFYKTNDYMKTLNEFKSNNLYKNWLIIPTNDSQVKTLSQNKEYLEEYFMVSTHNWDSVEKCYNKIKTYKIAKELNIPIAKSIFPKNIAELLNIDISYPCIIKPAVMHTFYSKFKKKVFVCNNKDELLKNYEEALTIIPSNEIIIQDIIPGGSEHQYSVGLHFREKSIYNHIIVRRKRQHPIDFGNATTFAESVEIDLLKAYSQKILSEIDYEGLCEVEFKYDTRDNQYKLLEINPRTWKWHSISQKAKVPFLLSLYSYIYDKKPIITTNFKKSCFKHILLDTIMLILHKEYRQTPPCTKEQTQFAVWDKEDLAPALWELIYFPKNVLKR